jgi:hypothetical protein
MAKKSTAEQLAEQKDELTIDVGDEDVKGQEVILEDESSKETQTEMNLETSSEETPPKEVKKEESEQSEYTDSVQKRIDKLTKKMREAERREKAALQFAESVKGESEQLRDRMKALDEGYLTEYGNRVDVEENSAEVKLKQALTSGDADAIIDAQKKLSEVTVSRERIRQAKVEQEDYQRRLEAHNQQQQQQPIPQNIPSPDPKAEQWAEKNKWFGDDQTMTYAAFGIHKQMVEEEKFDTNTDEYYTELDRRMRDEFPQKFSNGEATKKPAQTVASVSRNTPSKGRGKKVRLTSSQVAIAKKLGVPLEEYAKHVKE